MNSIDCSTPFCKMRITREGDYITEIDFLSDSDSQAMSEDQLLQQAVSQVKAYVASADRAFDLPLRPKGTEFQRKVWRALQRIPAGEVRTYGELARELNTSARAVGNACRQNPIPLVIPCHRVISASGLGGFAGETAGEKISLKQQLLAHEGVEI